MKKADYLPNDGGVSLAVKLRQFRLKAGFTQQNIAEILNISRSAYTYYETGKTSPDAATLNRIARIYDISIEDFFLDQPVDSSPNILKSPEPKRAPKKARPDPQRVGELSSEEKAIIAFLRDRGVPMSSALDVLKDYFIPLDEKYKGY